MQKLLQALSDKSELKNDHYQFFLRSLSLNHERPSSTFVGTKNLHQMSVMILHIVVSLIIALGFLGAFIWAIKTNQYEDDYSPSVRILFDDQESKNQKS